MSYIKSYGIALPHFRIEDTILDPKISGKKAGMKAVCFADEDINTLAFEASCNIPKENIDGIFFASSSPVFHNRYNSSYLGGLLNLPEGILTLDFINSQRSGTDALLLANYLIDSGKYKNILVVASDVYFPGIGTEVQSLVGHAACAILLSDEKGIAEITEAKSFSASFAEEFSYKEKKIVYDPRFSRNEGFTHNLSFSMQNFCANKKVFDAVILNSRYARMASAIFLKEGFEEKQITMDSLSSKIGNTGSVNALLPLINEIENEKKHILLIDYTNGSNLFEIKILSETKSKLLHDQLMEYETINSYQDYLMLRKAGDFKDSNYETKEMFSSEMMQEREKESLLYLKGNRCNDCGTIYYLNSSRCKKCKCDTFSEVTLQRTGTVYTLTKEHYFPCSFPPVSMLVIDLDGGGRMTVQQTDTMYPEKNKIEIGSKVKLVLRKMMENDAKPNYFWKAISA